MDKKNIKWGLLVTIGDQDIEFPWVKDVNKWADFSDVFDDALGIIEILMLSGGAIAVLMIIVGAYIFITSAGDPDKVEQGRKTLTGAIIGLIIVTTAWLIIRFVLGDILQQNVDGSF